MCAHGNQWRAGLGALIVEASAFISLRPATLPDRRGLPRMPVQRKQLELSVSHIRQHKGQPQVDRGVKVQVPGKHFPGLQPAEQKVFYGGTAIEHAERHKFLQHHKAWGSAHTGP